jgi:hypothetical protein
MRRINSLPVQRNVLILITENILTSQPLWSRTERYSAGFTGT